MADVEDTPVVAAEDTGISDAAQTTPDDDVSLDDLTFADLGLDDSEEEAPEAEPAKEAEPEQSEPEDEPETEEQSDDSTAEGEVTDPDAERKRFNDEMARQRIAERQAREEAKKAKDELEQERIKNYLAEAEGDAEEYAQRELSVEKYRLQMERATFNRERVDVGIEKALADERVVSILRDGSEAAKKEIYDALDTFEKLQIQKDDRGNYLQVNGDVYQTLVNKAESIRALTQAGAVNEAKTKKSVQAKTLQPPTRAPKEPKVDKDIEAFEKAFGY